MNRLRFAIGIVFVLVTSGVAAAQGVQTGTLVGTATDSGGLVLPGVTVTASAPTLQGVRTTVTDVNGGYSLPMLPPGDYVIRFELAGMRAVESRQRIDLGGTARLDVTMQLASLTETVQVTATPPALATTQGGANYRTEEIDRLPTSRTIARMAELAPGLTDNTPNGSQVTIAGGFAYDNQFLVDGVDVADNLFGSPNDLFIEEAIDEVQVLTSGIAAEYGRFGGGVVNAVTKSGGNTFSGSGRVNMYSPSWTQETPFEVASGITRQRNIQENYEGTFGGPLMRDRLWFFTAGRFQKSSSPSPLPETGIPFSTDVSNKRGEVKITGTVRTNHTLQGSYLVNNTESVQTALPGLSIDLTTAIDRQTPNDLWVVNYRGVLRNTLLANLQVSRRTFDFLNQGGTETAVARSPFYTLGVASGVPVNRFYNAPYFDATDPESRNNRQVTGSLNWLVATGAGSHDLKLGFENFVTTRTGGNSQTASGYVFRADYLLADGKPVLDGQGRIVPLFVPGVTRLERWLPTRGAQLDIATTSLYAQDRWTPGNRWTFDLGARFETVHSEATGDVRAVSNNRLVPRLGATFDVLGNKAWIAQASYAHYAGKYSETQFGANSVVGNPSEIVYAYSGPAGQGMDFVPGLALSNYRTLLGGDFPTAAVFFADDLRSPLTRELTLALGRSLGGRGLAKLSYQWRDIGDFVEDFVDNPTASGKVRINQDGVDDLVDRVEYRNSSGYLSRRYQGVVAEGNYRLSSRLMLNGHWTVQIRDHGTVEGEGANQPGQLSVFGDYPEITDEARSLPDGRLNDFQRHKVRAWLTWAQPAGKLGSVDLGVLYRYNSPLTFSYVAANQPLSASQLAANPGYASLPGFGAQNLYFGDRGAGEFESSQLVDLAATYTLPIAKRVRPWVKFELANLFNAQDLVAYNTQVTPDPTSPRDANGLATGYRKGSRFGQATSNAHFPRAATNFSGASLFARTFMMSFGVRF